MSFRILHQFTVPIEREVEETNTRTESGQTISVTSKVKKTLEYTIILKEPSRREKNDLALFKDVTYGDAINKGLVIKRVMQQKLTNSDAQSPLSEEEDKALGGMNARLAELINEYVRLKALPTADNEDTKERLTKVMVEYASLYKKISDINTAYQSVYAHTAENYTQTKMLTWLTLFLTYVKDPTQASDSVPRPLFAGSDYNAKEDRLGEMEDNKDDVLVGAIEKLPTYWMLYLFNKANSPEDYKVIEEEWAKEKKMREEAEAKVKEEATKVVEPAPEVATPEPTPVLI